MFNFQFICGEDLVLEKLSEKLVTGDSCQAVRTANTQELSEQLLKNPSEFTLQWVLDLVENKIKNLPGNTFLVDLVPNLKFLLKVPIFAKNCSKEMELFEEKVSMSFLLFLCFCSKIKDAESSSE